MSRIVSIDPGGATGIAYGHYDDETPYTLDHVLVVSNDVDGLADLYWNASSNNPLFAHTGDDLIVENYIMDHGPQDPIALQVIGFIRGVAEADVIFRRRSDKALVPDKVLKDHGLWQTGKTVGWTDGRDANDAIIHAIGWLAFKQRHQPTLARYYGVDPA